MLRIIAIAVAAAVGLVWFPATAGELEWERLSRDAEVGISYEGAAQTVNYYLVQRPEAFGKSPERAMMVISRLEYLINEAARQPFNDTVKGKLFDARATVREAMGWDAEISANDAILTAKSLEKFMALSDLPEERQVAALENDWTAQDFQYLNDGLKGLELEEASVDAITDVLDKLERGTLEDLQEARFDNLSDDLAGLNQGLGTVDIASLSRELGRAMADAGIGQAAEALSAAVSSGLSVDLESAAQGYGFDSFSDAVDAYNQTYGTNYTPDQARQALDR